MHEMKAGTEHTASGSHAAMAAEISRLRGTLREAAEAIEPALRLMPLPARSAPDPAEAMASIRRLEAAAAHARESLR